MAENRICGHCKEYEIPAAVSREEFDAMAQQVSEIHEFVKGLAGALNSPMLKAMLPPQVRGMIGG